jgi:hypothetical protein
MLKRLLCLLVVSAIPLYGKVYDCFTFFNEWEILEIRLNELYDHVDKFIIVECSTSHRGLPKQFNFEARQEVYKKFMDKIIYVKVYETNGVADDGTYLGSSWERENYQKNQVMRGLKECTPSDLILFSDVDEIPPGSMIPMFVEKIKTRPIIVMRQKFYRHFLNRYDSDGWRGTLAMRYDQLTDIPGRTPNQRRLGICFQGIKEVDGVPEGVLEIEGGWHFSSMGGFQKVQEKYYHWVHWQNAYPTTYQGWRWEVGLQKLVSIDATYPKFVQENLQYLVDCGLLDVTFKGEMR